MQERKETNHTRFNKRTNQNRGQKRSFYYGPTVGGERQSSPFRAGSNQSGRSDQRPSFGKSTRFEGRKESVSTFGSDTKPRYEQRRDSARSFSRFGGQKNFGQRTNRREKRNFSENIDISRFIKKAALTPESESEKITHTFLEFDFSKEIKNNLAHRKYLNPTPIQDQAIDHILQGKDLIGLANTGTGKTAAFLLPLIDKVFKNRDEHVLILAPTRELAIQIDDEFRQFSWNMKIFSAVCVGGVPIFKQINNLKRRPNFIIGTPGRLKDLADRGIIKYDSFKNVVIDEIDRMLDMGFINEIKDIMNALPKERQSLFFSATMMPKIKEIVEKFSNNPITVQVTKGETTDNVDQNIVRFRDKSSKFDQLKTLLASPELSKVLIFSETKVDVEKLTEELKNEGFRADSIHGDKKQYQRQTALRLFKSDDINILVATDVAARGIDVKDISHVINYTVPQTYTDYVHRIGRTGRGGSKGYALTFVETRY